MRLTSTYTKFVNEQIKHNRVNVISHDAAVRIDTKIAEAFNAAGEVSKKHKLASQQLLQTRLFKKFVNFCVNNARKIL